LPGFSGWTDSALRGRGFRPGERASEEAGFRPLFRLKFPAPGGNMSSHETLPELRFPES